MYSFLAFFVSSAYINLQRVYCKHTNHMKHNKKQESVGSASGSNGENTGTPSMNEISRHFNKPIHLAALALNISEIDLRKLCRKYGIKRWPFYYRSSVDSSQSKFLFNYINVPSLDVAKPSSMIECKNVHQNASMKDEMFSSFLVRNNNNVDEPQQANQQENAQSLSQDKIPMAQLCATFHQDPQGKPKKQRSQQQKKRNRIHEQIKENEEAQANYQPTQQVQEPVLEQQLPASSSSVQQGIKQEEPENDWHVEPKRAKREKLPSISDLLN